MNQPLWKVYITELLGTFALVFFSSAIICTDQMTAISASPAQDPVVGHQPGLLGIALVQGLILIVVWVITVPISGGFVNPAITLMLGVFHKLPMIRVVWLIWAQIVGAVLAGISLRLTFSDPILESCHYGMPHLSPLAFPGTVSWRTLCSGMVWELCVTFLLVLAYLRVSLSDETKTTQLTAASLAGMTLTAVTLVGYALSGSATNPVRWLGPAVWEWLASANTNDPRFGISTGILIYGLGPVLGSMLAGLIHFGLLSQPDSKPDPSAKSSAEKSKKSSRSK